MATSLLIYVIPVLLVQFWDGQFLAAYGQGIVLNNVFLTWVVAIVMSTSIFTLCYLPLRLPKLNLPYIEISVIFWMNIGIWILVVAFSCFELISQLGLFDLFLNSFTDPVAYALEQPLVGVNLGSGGLLRYYFLSHYLIVIWFFLFKSADLEKRKNKIFFWITFFIINLFHFYVTRRETLLFNCLVLIIGFQSIVKTRHIVIGILVFTSASIFLVLSRFGAEQEYKILSYFLSEEFYPFQLGFILVDEWISTPTMGSIIALTPFSLIDNESSTLSAQQMLRLFNHLGPGPTVSFFYPIIAFGILPALCYFSMSIVIMKAVYIRICENGSQFVLIPLYAYLCLKLFLLIRNGELVNHFVDCIIFSALYLPFYFIRNGVLSKS